MGKHPNWDFFSERNIRRRGSKLKKRRSDLNLVCGVSDVLQPVKRSEAFDPHSVSHNYLRSVIVKPARSICSFKLQAISSAQSSAAPHDSSGLLLESSDPTAWTSLESRPLKLLILNTQRAFFRPDSRRSNSG